jgi:hypothetical protein
MTDDVLVFAHGRLLEKTSALSLSGSSLGEGMRG